MHETTIAVYVLTGAVIILIILIWLRVLGLFVHLNWIREKLEKLNAQNEEILDVLTGETIYERTDREATQEALRLVPAEKERAFKLVAPKPKISLAKQIAEAIKK